MKSIIYIRLDSSPLPTATPNLIIKDVNTENYFCSFLGKQIMNKANCTNLTVFPGQLLIDYASVDKSAYDEIMQKYSDILKALLSDTSKSVSDFSLQLPFEFIDWLCCHENDDYREIGNHLFSSQISFTSIDLYDAIVDKVLLPQLKFFFKKQKSEQIEFISYSLPLPQDNLLSRNLAIDNIRIADIRELKLNTEYESFCACNGMTRIMNKETKKYGFINENGEEVIPCIYDFVTDFNTDTAFAYDGKECYKLHLSGEKEIICSIDSTLAPSRCVMGSISDKLISAHTDVRQFIFYNRHGQEMLKVDGYDDVGDFSEGLARVNESPKENAYGYINKKGEVSIPCQFIDAGDFSEGLAYACLGEDEDYGYIDKHGEFIIPAIYSSCGDFQNGRAHVYMDDEGEEGGYIDSENNFIADEYAEEKQLSEGMILKREDMDDDVVHIYNQDSTLAFSFCAGKFSNFSEGSIVVHPYDHSCGGKGYMILDKKGKTIYKYKSDYSLEHNIEEYAFSNGRALFQRGKWDNVRFGYIDKCGKVVISCDYQHAFKFSDGLALVAKERWGKFGYIDAQGNIIIPLIFDDAGSFYEGVAWVRKGNKYGIILREWFVK